MVTPLESYLADKARVSVSGISAGAFMAHQLHIAYSDVFMGAGLIAGGPYMSSQGSLFGALAHGLHGMPPPDHRQLSRVASSLAAMGAIASTSNLAKSRVWMFHGKRDTTVKRQVSDSLALFYKRYLDKDALCYVNTVDVVHAMPTNHYGLLPSNAPESPYIVNCNYDAAGAMLTHIYGALAPRVDELGGKLVEFDQRPFLGGASGHSMDKTGFMYLPSAALAGKKCGVHVALHGCKQSRETIGDIFATSTGYNEWAESNDLIVLYPQAAATTSMGLFNPLGSWDWWSYTGQDYALRSGRQMKAIYEMVTCLTSSAVNAK